MVEASIGLSVEDDAYEAVKMLGVVLCTRARPHTKPMPAAAFAFFPGIPWPICAHTPDCIRIRTVARAAVRAVNVLCVQLVGYLCLLPTGPNKTTVMSQQAMSGLGAFAGLHRRSVRG